MDHHRSPQGQSTLWPCRVFRRNYIERMTVGARLVGTRKRICNDVTVLLNLGYKIVWIHINNEYLNICSIFWDHKYQHYQLSPLFHRGLFHWGCPRLCECGSGGVAGSTTGAAWTCSVFRSGSGRTWIQPTICFFFWGGTIWYMIYWLVVWNHGI